MLSQARNLQLAYQVLVPFHGSVKDTLDACDSSFPKQKWDSTELDDH